METNSTDAALAHEAFDLPGYAVLVSHDQTETLHGPFPTADEAAEWGMGVLGTWQVLHLVPVEDPT